VESEIEPALTGAAFDLANAGYTSMPDPERREESEPIGGDSASLRDAAEQRSTSEPETVVRQYTDARGKPVAPREAVTLARASRDYASATSADRRAAEGESTDELAARIDSLRAEVAAHDPEAAAFYGFEPADRDVDGSGESDAEPPQGPDGRQHPSTQLDPDLEKLMQHPQVRRALEEKVGEVERARQGYVDGLGAAVQIAQASFVSQFPELTGFAAEQLPAALEQMSRQDPARFSRVQAIIAGSEQLLARQQQEMRRQADTMRQNFRQFAHAEDARLEAMLEAEPKQVRQAVAQEILASAKASGIESDELNRLFNSEPLMRNATFQRMMYDAGKYRLMMKAKEAAVARPLPSVQRPGAAASRGERQQSDLRSLNARLSTSGDLKDAVALYQARKAGRP
jgi:hypothetical protein